MLYLFAVAGLVLGHCCMFDFDAGYVEGFRAAVAVIEDLQPRDPAALRSEARRLAALDEPYWRGWASAFTLAAEDLTDPVVGIE